MSNEIKEIEQIFETSNKFLSKISRKANFDIGYVKIKDKLLLGYHLECYTSINNKPKRVDVQFWIGSVTDLKEETIDKFLEEFPYDKTNGYEIYSLKINDIEKHKLAVYEIIGANIK